MTSNLSANSHAQTSPSQSLHVYFGGSTPECKGIYHALFNPASGKLSAAKLVSPVARPGFLVIHPNHPFLYAACLIDGPKGEKISGVTAFSLNGKTGDLTKINEASTVGMGACHLSMDPEGRNLLVANYAGGSIAVLPVDSNGKLGSATTFIQHEGKGPFPKRQDRAHAHSINLDPSAKRAYVADLGMDKIMIYDFDGVNGKLTPHHPAFVSTHPGAGPRHLAIHPNGKWFFVINELNSTITEYAHDSSTGNLKELQTISTLPSDFTGENTCAEVAVHPNGKFVYGSNRGHDSIAVYSLSDDGTLSLIEITSTKGKTPRHFALTPDGRFLVAANMGSNDAVVFAVNSHTGKLTPTGSTIEVPGSTCVRFLPVQE